MADVITIDTRGLRDLAGRFRRNNPANRGTFRREVREIAEDLLDATRAKAPRRTGELARSLGLRVSADQGTRIQIQLTAGAPHTRFILHGTRPHVIMPRRRRVLRFEVRGRAVYARRVRHPGTKPNAFYLAAFRQLDIRRRLQRIAGRVAVRILD